jgi:sulfur-carrier protein
LQNEDATDHFASELMADTTVTITLKLFAAYQEASGVAEMSLELPPGTTVVEVCDRLIQQHPALNQWRDLTRFGVNLQFVEPDTVLQDGDEVVLIPPVSGG